MDEMFFNPYLKFVKHVPIYKSIIGIFVDLLRMSKKRITSSKGVILSY